MQKPIPPFEEWNEETTKPIYKILVEKYGIDPFELWTFLCDELPLSHHSIKFQSALKEGCPKIWQYSKDCELYQEYERNNT